MPLAPFEKILKESGKNIRVSESATKEFVKVVEEISRGIGSEAAVLARHASRKTILDTDIQLASKRKT